MVGPLNPGEPIQLQEYGIPKDYPANLVDIQALKAASQYWKRRLGLDTEPLQADLVREGFVRLRAAGVTGVVRIGQTDIEVAPKFLDSTSRRWQTALWRILTLVDGGHIDDNVTSASELAPDSLADLLAEIFLSSFLRGAARGLPRGYSTQSSAGPVLRGALDVSRIGSWIASPWRVPYVTDVLTEDTPLGRLIRWTAATLASTVRSPGRARQLREVVSSLPDVRHRPPHLLDAQRIALGVQHQGLEPARLIGLLLLEGRGVQHDNGKHSLSGFLWNSSVIYESFVFWLCRRAASRAGLRIHKRPYSFGTVLSGTGAPFETTPDVVFANASGEDLAVMDAKYKTLGHRPKAPDTYQVLAAAHVIGCRRVSLAYPVDNRRDRTVWRVESLLGSGEVEVSAIPLNLMALAYTANPQELIGAIRNWLEADKLNEALITENHKAPTAEPA